MLIWVEDWSIEYSYGIDVTPDGEIAVEFWTLDEASRRMSTDSPPALID